LSKCDEIFLPENKINLNLANYFGNKKKKKHGICDSSSSKSMWKFCMVDGWMDGWMDAQEENGLRTYVHLGTGNYNPRTASVYSDFGLLRYLSIILTQNIIIIIIIIIINKIK
jgi:hypothetical protein